jgi:hypothetical protein
MVVLKGGKAVGTWGTEPWENDEAADWFGEFFEGIDVDARIEEAFAWEEDNQERIRAACFLLGALGRVYVWPGDLDRLKGLHERGIELLARMLEPDDEDESYVDRWPEEHRPAVTASIQQQIALLKERQAHIA